MHVDLMINIDSMEEQEKYPFKGADCGQPDCHICEKTFKDRKLKKIYEKA